MDTFWNTFLTILVVELTDRTRVVALLLSARFRAPVALVVGMTAGYLIPTGLAVYGAEWISRAVPAGLLRAGVALSFLGFGAWMLWDREGEQEEAEGKSAEARWSRWARLGPLLTGFLWVTVAEFADKSQIATAVLAARLRPAGAVFAGAVAAQGALNAVYVLLGQWLGKRLPAALIRRVAGWGFIAAGLAGFFLG